MKSVIILGGSGFVGRALCRQLSVGGDWLVRVMTRDPARTSALTPLRNVVVEQLDIRQPGALNSAARDCDAVVNLVAILHGSPRDFQQIHVDLPRRIGVECAGSAKRLVHVSALGVDSQNPSLYLRSKAEGERAVRGAVPATTLLRPSVIFGREDRFLNTFERLQRFVPFVPLACSNALFQPVWVEDVARAILATLRRPDTAGKVYECVGPDIFTLSEIVHLAGRRGKVERPVLPLPLALSFAQAWLMERLPGEPIMTRDNVRSMLTPNVASRHGATMDDLGITPRSLPDYLAGGHAA